MLVLFASCKKQRPKQVWIYNEDGAEMLYGNVKELSIGDSAKGDFYAMYFDREGNMSKSINRSISISQTIIEKDSTKDTTVYIDTIKYIFEFGQNGKKTAIIGNVSSVNLQYRSKWEFDKEGKLTRSTNGIDDSISSINEYKNDTAGNVIERKYSHMSGHIAPDIYKYKYDNTNRMIEEDLLDESWLLTKNNFRYISFDSHNNWIKMISHSESFPPMSKFSHTDTTTRKITYY